MTLQEMQDRKKEIIATKDMKDVLISNGVQVRNNVCKCMFHNDSHPSMKVFKDAVMCFVCGRQWNVFDVTMQLNGCDFKTAFDMLGGNVEYDWKTQVAFKKAKRIREQKEFERKLNKERLHKQYIICAAIRANIRESEPFSDDWCYFTNKLDYQEYLLQEYERMAEDG